jgi:hypothetical protein
MSKNATKTTALLTLGAGLGLSLLVGVGMMIGVIGAGNQQVEGNSNKITLPEGIPLEAGTSSVGKKISMATGPIDGEVEGLFVLDHLTGQLTCFIVNPRGLGGAVPLIGQFKANVPNDLGLDKSKGDPDYVMTIGGVNALRGGGAARPAQCIVYVADGNTGNVVGYSLGWDPTAARSGRLQGGPLLRVMIGKARPNVIEE